MSLTDLHVHSNFSDSSRTVEEVLKIASDKGIKNLSIVDHDTVETIDYIKTIDNLGINIIPGIEISAYDFKRNRKVHILGYGYNENPINIKNLCKDVLKRRHENSLRQIEEINKLGYKIDLDKVNHSINSDRTIYKQHIMDYITDDDFNSEAYQTLYKKLFKNGGVAHFDIKYVDAYDAVEAINLDGGIPVLAHPGETDSFEIAKDLSKNGLKGIEVYHISHNKEHEDRALELVKKYNLIITGGSDEHGNYGKKSEFGVKTSLLNLQDFNILA